MATTETAMEQRVAALETEMRSLRRALAAAAESVMRELARVADGDEEGRGGLERGDGEEIGAVSEEEEEGQENGQSMEPTTSQESVMSFGSSASGSSGLSLREFDHVINGERDGGIPVVNVVPPAPRRPVTIPLTHAGSSSTPTVGSRAREVITSRIERAKDVVASPQACTLPPPRPPPVQCELPRALSSTQVAERECVPVVVSPLHKEEPVTAEVWKAPADFEVPTNVSVAVAWEKWCCGDPSLHLPPFRTITHKQVANKAMVRRLSDMRCAMQPIEATAKAHGMWKPTITPEEARATFMALQDHLPLCAISGGSRKKQIAWSTALNALRKKRKLGDEQ